MNTADFPDPPDRPRRSELQKLRDQLQQGLQPLRSIVEMQEALKRNSPHHQAQELMRQFDPHRHLRETLQGTSALTSFQSAMAESSLAFQAQRLLERHFPLTTLANLGLAKEALGKAAVPNSVSEIAQHYERYLKPIRDQQELRDLLNRQAFGGISAIDFARQLERANPAFKAIEDAKKSLDRIGAEFGEIDFDQLEVSAGEVQDVAIAAEEIVKAATSEPTLKEAVDQIVAAIEEQRNPAVKLVLWLYFRKALEILVSGVVSSVLSVYISAAMAPSNSPQADSKVVKEAARQAVVAPDLLAEYRYVSTKVLVVRQNARANSAEIAKLTFGKPVKLLKKEKDFAFVVWSDQESGAEVHGWVFARYLRRFN